MTYVIGELHKRLQNATDWLVWPGGVAGWRSAGRSGGVAGWGAGGPMSVTGGSSLLSRFEGGLVTEMERHGRGKQVLQERDTFTAPTQKPTHPRQLNQACLPARPSARAPQTALKTLITLHRLMRETDPSFMEEVRPAALRLLRPHCAAQHSMV